MKPSLRTRWTAQTPKRWASIRTVSAALSGGCMTLLPLLLASAHAGPVLIGALAAGFLGFGALAAYAQLQYDPTQLPPDHELPR